LTFNFCEKGKPRLLKLTLYLQCPPQIIKNLQCTFLFSKKKKKTIKVFR
jgi:hypothetical protein